MIEIKNVSKSYDKKKEFITDMNLKVENGEIFGFLGSNGAGKTTTIKMITGIINMDKGDILIDSKSIKNNPIEAKQNIGFVLDSPDMFLRLKGIDYLNFIADMYNVSKENRKERIENLAKRLNIFESLSDKISNYSHGMRQKIMIIGALLNNPNNWILDEPLVGLDPKSSHELKELMVEEAKMGKTVFFSTHILEVAEKLCDRIGIINNGKIVFIGTIDELKDKLDSKDESLEKLFLNLTENNN